MSTPQKDWISKWLPLIVAVGANIVTVAYGYGQLTQRLLPIEHHVANAPSHYVTRGEFAQRTTSRDSEMKDLKDRLSRIEQKLDRLIERE